VILLATDFRGEDLFAIDGDDERVRCLVALIAGVAFLDSADQTSKQLVIGVSGEHVIHHGSSTGAERETVDMHVLAELATD